MKSTRTQAGSFFRIGAAVLAAAFVSASAHAQNTNNPYTVNTTNSVALAPIANGFGVAMLGYPMVTIGATNSAGNQFFADTLDGVALSDTTVLDVNTLQFYAANEDNQIGSGLSGNLDAFNIVGFHVLQSTSNPNSLTVCKSFVASIQTNGATGTGAGYGSGCAGTMGLGGVSKNGTIVFRMDGTSAPGTPGMAGEAVVTVPAQVPSTVIMTNAVVTNLVARTIGIDSNTGNTPQIGQNGLVVKNSFGGVTYVGRPDIFGNPIAPLTSVSPPNPPAGTNNQCIVGTASVSGTFNLASWNTRGVMGINETAKRMVGYVKSPQDLTTGGDSMTSICTIKYTDSGSGPITATSLQTNYFGTTTTGNWPAGGINTNGQYFFSRVAFNGPSQISINDSGNVAFAVSINIDAANDNTNGTRAAQVTGVIFVPANAAPGATNALPVVANTNPTLFWQVPNNGTCVSNKNLISDVAIDNMNNVYFEAAYTNNTLYPCDFFPSNAVYEAVANDPFNPTSWTTRILLRQGDQFTDPVSGSLIQVTALPYQPTGLSFLNTKTVTQRSFGPNAINRTQLPGHTSANTTPNSAFAVGGILVQATVTNITQGFSSDTLLYIAPYTTTITPLFVITSIARSNNDVNITWNGQVGNNIVQVTGGDAGGNYQTNMFTDVATITLSSSVVTNYTDSMGATNTPSRYYRVKLQ